MHYVVVVVIGGGGGTCHSITGLVFGNKCNSNK